jgi:ABC-type nickel/cobalt efflux system permease component RcnA
VDTWVWILIVAAAVVVLLVAAWALARSRRSRQLREGFGPEYERTVDETGSRRQAEAELAERQKRREDLDIRPLTPAARDRYLDRWQETQARFVDDPGGAVGDADRLVQEVMRERGYPTDDFEQRAADISVDHPNIVENYRSAHGIAQAHEHGEASTEDLRQSLVHYRTLFEELLETTGSERVEVER